MSAYTPYLMLLSDGFSIIVLFFLFIARQICDSSISNCTSVIFPPFGSSTVAPQDCGVLLSYNGQGYSPSRGLRGFSLSVQFGASIFSIWSHGSTASMHLRLMLVTCAYISLASGYNHPGYTELGHSISSLDDETIAEIVMREFFENQNRYINVYGPSVKADDCNAGTLKKNSTLSHCACTAECFAISDTIRAGHLNNPQHKLIAKLHRECTGFDEGVCIPGWRWATPFCECRGVGFKITSRSCRGLIFGIRITNNVVTFVYDGIKHYNDWRINYIQRKKRELANWDLWKEAYGKNYKTEAEAVAAYKQIQREIYEKELGPSLLSGGHGDSFHEPWIPPSHPRSERSFRWWRSLSRSSRSSSSSRSLSSSSSSRSSSSRRFSFDRNDSRSNSRKKPVTDPEHPSLNRALTDIPVTH